MFRDKVSIIIPTKNEQDNVKDIIQKCAKYSNDIIIIDGHSKDDTVRIAKEMNAKVFLDDKKGKGAAMRLGLTKSTKEIVVFIDADGSHDPEDIPAMVTPIIEGKTDHVSTSRMRGGSDELHGDIWKFIRMVGSDIITLGINYKFGKD
ncbi:MAG: glycosyltransferase family 2 protein, partial [Candidatus Omnitrophica bacterium]|nr:glycosyltransferase family 2 protein [Candidatus Omnitrophota bacterium]